MISVERQYQNEIDDLVEQLDAMKRALIEVSGIALDHVYKLETRRRIYAIRVEFEIDPPEESGL